MHIHVPDINVWLMTTMYYRSLLCLNTGVPSSSLEKIEKLTTCIHI